MIFGMPASDFWVFGIWSIIYVSVSLYIYWRMSIADAKEEEYEKGANKK